MLSLTWWHARCADLVRADASIGWDHRDVPEDVDDSLSLGCGVMAAGMVLLGLSAMLYGGAAMNKTTTGVLEPVLAFLGFAVLIAGIILRARWVHDGR